jgi:hypothetical protein
MAFVRVLCCLLAACMISRGTLADSETSEDAFQAYSTQPIKFLAPPASVNLSKVISDTKVDSEC